MGLREAEGSVLQKPQSTIRVSKEGSRVCVKETGASEPYEVIPLCRKRVT